MPLLHIHKWKVVDQQPIQVYEGFYDDMPTGYKTHLALQCEVCGDVKSKTIKGIFLKPL